MAVVFIAIKPAGAVLLRVIPGRLGFHLHVGWQTAGMLIAVVGVGMGIYLARVMDRVCFLRTCKRFGIKIIR